MTFYNDNRPPPHTPTIYLHTTKLKSVREQRHLGITFQHNLRWTTHINNIINKSLKTLHTLTKLRNSLNAPALCHLYSTHVRPILEYACIAVTPLPQNTLDRLERLQRKAARICLNLPMFSAISHSTLLHKLSLPTLFSRRKIKQLILAHSIFHSYAPPHLLEVPLPPLTTAAYPIRRPRTYHLPTSRTDRHKNSPLYKALDYFNRLICLLIPEDFRESFRDHFLLRSLCLPSQTTTSCSLKMPHLNYYHHCYLPNHLPTFFA